MFSEILKIIPKIDQSALRAMERTLQGRFTKIAKGFGKGLMNVLKGGGIAGVALAFIDKLLNPLKEVQEAIDRTLKTSDDLATNARQFNTSSGKLFKLVQLAKAQGLEEDNLYQLITKYQTAVAQAKANPKDDSVSSVRNFTDQQDIAEGFFNFIQSLQKLDKNQQVLVQQQVFGEKQILRMAEFMQSDFSNLAQRIGLDKISSQKLTGGIEKISNLEELARVLQGRRETGDIMTKSRIINEGMINARDRTERLALIQENKRIQSYQDLSAISDTVTKIMTLVESGMAMIGKFINIATPAVTKLIDFLEKVPKMSIFRGIFKWGKDD